MANAHRQNRIVILLVEDEALLRLNAVDILEDAGFEIVEADTALAALKILETRPDVQVLFTDIQMPGPIDGIELARRVREQWPHVLLLITSGNIRPLKTDIPDHGHFLAKPYYEAEVVREVRNLVREGGQRR